jgi:predicted nuclease with TOPRIM domain
LFSQLIAQCLCIYHHHYPDGKKLSTEKNIETNFVFYCENSRVDKSYEKYPYKPIVIPNPNVMDGQLYLVPAEPYRTKYIGLTYDGPKIHTLDEWQKIDLLNYDQSVKSFNESNPIPNDDKIFSDLRFDLLDIQNKMNSCHEKIKSLKDENNNIIKENLELKDECETNSITIQTLQNLISDLKIKLKEFEGVQQKNSDLEQKIINLNAQLKELEDVRGNFCLRRKISILNSKLNDVQQKNSFLEKERLDFDSNLKDVQQKNTLLQSTIKNLEQEISILKKNSLYLNIKNYIDQSLLNKIENLQKLCTTDMTTCCACLEDTTEIVPLKCEHELCNKCYEQLKDQSCPICESALEIKKVQILIAVMTKINLKDLVIFYLPPINNGDGLIDYDVFQNIADDKNELRRFLTVCNRINKESYHVVLNGDILDCWMKFNVVRNLKIISVDMEFNENPKSDSKLSTD